MSVMRRLSLQCDGPECSAKFHGKDQVFVDGPVRTEAAKYGWLTRTTAMGNEDYCPDHAAVIRLVVPG